MAEELSSAKDELQGFEAEAEKIFAEAKAAADAVIAKVKESERERANMMRQLATLKDTADDVERQRIEGLEAERRQNLVKSAPTAPELYSVAEPADHVFIDNWFKRIIHYDLAIYTADVTQQQDGVYRLDLPITASRNEVDETGTETPLLFDHPVEIAVSFEAGEAITAKSSLAVKI